MSNINGSNVRFEFAGKSGKKHEIGLERSAARPRREALP